MRICPESGLQTDREYFSPFDFNISVTGGVVARLSGEEESLEGCGESNVLVPGDS